MKKIILNIVFILLFISCGGGGEDPEPEPTPLKPESSELVFPNKNSECTEGTNITETNSTVNFKWNNSLNTDSYELVLKNLETDIITKQESTTNQLNVELLRGSPYSWYVISKSISVTDTANSETWKFYNAGEATVSYAPFPAEVVSPAKGASVSATDSKITLDWNATDIDNDIESYSIYFGTNSNPALMSDGITESILTDVSVDSETTYYWYVVTIDQQGNSSTSEHFEFEVN